MNKKSSTIEYRPAKKEDAAAIADLMITGSGGLFEFLLQGIIPGMTVNKMLAQQVSLKMNELSHQYTMVAVANDKVVGIAHSYPAEQHKITTGMRIFIPNERLDHVKNFFNSRVNDSLYLHCLAVSDGFRNKGVGTELINQSIAKAKVQNLEKLSLHVWADNTKAKKLYDNLGFNAIETVAVENAERLQHEGGSILMARDL